MAQDTFDDLIAVARRHRGNRRTGDAATAYERAHALDPTRPELCELMEIYVEQGHWSRAVDLGILISESALERATQGRLSLREAEVVYRRVLAAMDGLSQARESSLLDRALWILGKIDTLTSVVRNGGGEGT